MFDEFSLVIHRCKFYKFKSAHRRHDNIRTGDAVGVETDTLAADRKPQIEVSPWRKDTAEISYCLQSPLRVDGIAIATEAHVFHNMETRK